MTLNTELAEGTEIQVRSQTPQPVDWIGYDKNRTPASGKSARLAPTVIQTDRMREVAQDGHLCTGNGVFW